MNQLLAESAYRAVSDGPSDVKNQRGNVRPGLVSDAVCKSGAREVFDQINEGPQFPPSFLASQAHLSQLQLNGV